MKRYFITGTDTDCGKTYVTAKLLDFLNKAVAIKPVASGCVKQDDQWVNPDAQILQQHCHLPLEHINPWRFQLPVSPHIAAKKEGASLLIPEIANYCMNFSSKGMECLLIEGAGGILVPLNERETWIDFLKQTRIPVIIVVGLRLGCINHALLTQMALEINHLPCLGWIANCLDPNMLAIRENIDTLKNKMKMPLLATFTYLGEILDINLDLLTG
jgi:dethiobiotin synthetase